MQRVAGPSPKSPGRTAPSTRWVLLDAHTKFNLQRLVLYVRRGVRRRWRVEHHTLDSGRSALKSAAVDAGVPLGRRAAQWSYLEKQVPSWELGFQTIGR